VLHNGSSYTAPLRFLGTSDTADAATISSRFDKKAFTAGFDMLLMRDQKFSVHVGYRGEWGKTTQVQNLHLKATLAF
jgi:hypothetical protein